MNPRPLLLLIMSVLLLTGCSQSAEMKKAFDEGYSKGEEIVTQKIDSDFSKDDALAKVQSYQIASDWKEPAVPKGTTLKEAFELAAKIPAITNEGWDVKELESGKYEVTFKRTISSYPKVHTWEVTRASIKAVNGAALSLTPELEDKSKAEKPLSDIEATETEKRVYVTFGELYKAYEKQLFSESEIPTSDQLVAIEDRALNETASKFNMETKDVKEIYSRLDMSSPRNIKNTF